MFKSLDTYKYSPIIISGNATSGKDTLFECISFILKSYDIDNRRFALADNLKTDLNEFTTKHYGISSYTKNPEEKELIRDLMVIHGRIKRIQTKGTYWTSLLLPQIKQSLEDNILPIITDCRFDEYEQDEVFWCKNILKGNLIYVERILENGQKVPPVNDSELQNQDKLIKAADYKVTWPTTRDFNLRLDCVKIQLKPLLEKICPNYQL